MKNFHHPQTTKRTKSKNSFYHQHQPVILGMGFGVLLGIIMGRLFEDPGLGMAFGLSVGGGYWYTLDKKKLQKD